MFHIDPPLNLVKTSCLNNMEIHTQSSLTPYLLESLNYFQYPNVSEHRNLSGALHCASPAKKKISPGGKNFLSKADGHNWRYIRTLG